MSRVWDSSREVNGKDMEIHMETWLMKRFIRIVINSYEC